MTTTQSDRFSGCENVPEFSSGTTDRVLPPSRTLEELTTLPPELDDVILSAADGFDMPIDSFRSTFFPNAAVIGASGNPRVLLERPMIVGVIVNCFHDLWWIESEPTRGDAFGMVAYVDETAEGGPRRKAILSGEGHVEEGNAGPAIRATLNTVYPFVRSSPRRDSVSIGVEFGPAKWPIRQVGV